MKHSKILRFNQINLCRISLAAIATMSFASAYGDTNETGSTPGIFVKVMTSKKTPVPDAWSVGVTHDGPGTPAPDLWSIKATPQFTYGSYQGSPTRNSITSAGVYADAQYLERGGITVGAMRTSLSMKLGAPTLQQNNAFLSGRLNFTPDLLPGRLTLRADIHQANNNDVTNETNGVSAIAPHVSFTNFEKTRYFALGYTRSRYGDSNIGNGSLTITQWTPTVGLGFNQGADWLQLRAYDIRVSNAVRAQNNAGTDAVEVKWTHYLASAALMPEQIQIGALLGKRIYAVDSDSASIYNLADMQRGSVSLGAQWKLTSDARLLLQSGHERYVSSGGIGYSGTYIYAGISNQW